MKMLVLLLFSMVSMSALVSCSSDQKNELKKSFSTKVAEKVKAASIHSLGCETGDSVYLDVKNFIDKKTGVESESGHKSLILTALCEQGVKIAFPYLVDIGTGKLPQSWKDDGCSMKSVGDDIETVAYNFCKKIPK